MNLQKTANGKLKLKMSHAEWRKIGLQYGWIPHDIKQAQSWNYVKPKRSTKCIRCDKKLTDKEVESGDDVCNVCKIRTTL